MFRPKKECSIIIPVYNEEGNLASLISNISESCSSFKHEIIVVDDGSTDATPIELAELKRIYKSLRIITLKRNFGQTAAMAAGIDHAGGKYIVPVDGDGQNDPKDIPRLLDVARSGFDVVSGWRKDRQDPLLTRKIPSWLANALISIVTGVHLHDYGCTLKVYKHEIIRNIQLAGEMHRFLPAWCVWQGGKVTEMPVTHHPRRRGQSKYGMMRIFKVIIDLITLKFFSGYLSKPNYIFSGTALFMFFVSFLTTLATLVDKFGPDLYPKFRVPVLLVAMFCALVGVFLILMGLLAELLVRLYYEVRKQKPYRLANE
jgi:dolichol-phosphate mannosyltransferase